MAVNWFEIFWSIIALSFYPKSDIYLNIFPHSWRFLPTKPVFESISTKSTKASYQYIFNLMSKKKWVASMLELTFIINPSYVCSRYEHFLASLFCKISLACWTEFSQSWKDLGTTLQSHENLRSLINLSGANIGFHSNSRDWLVFMMSNINLLINKKVMFWKDV